MRRALAAAALAVLTACAPGAGPRPAPATRTTARVSLPALPATPSAPRHGVVISVAGMTPEAYLGAPGLAPAMPMVAELGRSGVLALGVEPVAPAAPYPAHATLLTGQPPSRHGVTSDRLLGERGVRRAFYWHASHVRSRTLWQAAGEGGRRVAAIGWPGTLGAAIELVLPEVFPTRPGETLPALLADAATPWLRDLALEFGAERPEAAFPGPLRDEMLARIACEVIGSEAPPDLLLLHLSQTEAALQEHGPYAPEAREAFVRADAEVARVVDCLARVGRLATGAVVVVGDHGTLPIHTLVRPNAVLLDAGLIEPERGGSSQVSQWLAIARSNGGSAFVYARQADDALGARRALERAAEQSRAFRVVPAEEMLRVGADPEAWFGLEAEPGYAFGDALGPSLLAPSGARGAGGYLPDVPAMAPGFVAWGPGLRDGLRVPRMRQTDVAPTLARLLGLDLGDVEGRVLVGLLRLPDVATPAAPEP